MEHPVKEFGSKIRDLGGGLEELEEGVGTVKTIGTMGRLDLLV